MRCAILYQLYNLKKHEKHPWKSVNFSKVVGFKPATLLKLTLLHGYFLRFLNCTNGTKSRNTSHISMTAYLMSTSRSGTYSWKRQLYVTMETHCFEAGHFLLKHNIRCCPLTF